MKIQSRQRDMKNCNYLLGLDLGTSNIKGVVISGCGEIIALGKTPVPYDKENNSIVEFDAVEFYELVVETIKKTIKDLENPGCIKAISMVSASGNTVLLNENMNPMRKALSWTDRRFTDEADIVLEKPDYMALYDKIGWPYHNSFPLAHLSWLKLNEPEKLKAAHKVCMVTDYVNYRLSGKLATNPSTATTLYLMDQKQSQWSEEIIGKMGINSKSLPKIFKSGEIIGYITDRAAKNTGLNQGTPVVAGSFDHPGAARGTGILKEGDLLLSCGTSWVGFYPVKSRKKIYNQEMLIDPFMQGKGCWGGMFSLPSISGNIDKLIKKWISDTGYIYDEFNRLATKAQLGAEGLKINPMTDSDKDFSCYSCKNIARAVMEGTAFLMKEKIRHFAINGITAKRIVMVGGPTQSKIWPQIVCDIIGIGIDVVYSDNAGAVGAAVMAGIGIGIYNDENDAWDRRMPEIVQFHPDVRMTAEYKRLPGVVDGLV